MVNVSEYLHRKASANRIPLNACFELSPVCNFSCRMCYVRRTPAQIARQGERLKDWTQWLDLARQCRDAGTLYLLLTGGEPFLYPNFRRLYEALHQMGFVISINSNGTLIDRDTVEWLKAASPARINLTLYGASPETYRRICGNADGYARATHAVEMLLEAGIPLVINSSLIPENVSDLQEIIAYGKRMGVNTRVSTYMFPPLRRDHEQTDSRFSAEEAAQAYLDKLRCQMGDERMKQMLRSQAQEFARRQSCGDDWGRTAEHMRCRAGRSSFWVSWNGRMTACGMFPFPAEFDPFSRPFYDCWMELTERVRSERVLKDCVQCELRDFCRPCAAMLYAETGDVNRCAPYLCRMAGAIRQGTEKILNGEERICEKNPF